MPQPPEESVKPSLSADGRGRSSGNVLAGERVSVDRMSEVARVERSPHPKRTLGARLKGLGLGAILVAGAIATPIWLGFLLWVLYGLASWLAE